METKADPWSATRFDVHRRLRELRATDREGVLATVVDVEGSAYRRPGAKLVIDDASKLGAITAGCLEGPLLDLAERVRETGDPLVETFDLTDDEEWGIGLGCNGVIDILVEPIDDSLDSILAELENKRPGTVVTVVESSDETVPLGARSTVTSEGTVVTPSDRPAVPDPVVEAVLDQAHATPAERTAGVEAVTVDDRTVRVFVDGMTPIQDLVLFGNQNDIHPVSRLASQVGFRVIVASARGAKSDEDEFPYADEVRAVRAPDLASAVDEADYTSVVLMSHNFIDDRLALESLLAETDVPYIGLMGPRKRFERMREELAEEGVELDEAALRRIATPVGLDLGGGEPVEIATSIVGEVLAVTNGRPGGRLRDTAEPIHPGR